MFYTIPVVLVDLARNTRYIRRFGQTIFAVSAKPNLPPAGNRDHPTVLQILQQSAFPVPEGFAEAKGDIRCAQRLWSRVSDSYRFLKIWLRVGNEKRVFYFQVFALARDDNVQTHF
jgi:hypothetical protein